MKLTTIIILLLNFLYPPIETRKFKSITENYFSLEGKKEKLTKTILFTFDIGGHLLKEEEKDTIGKIIKKEIYLYDSLDSLSQRKIYGPDQKVVYRSEYLFDLNENKKECCNYSGEDKLLSKTITFFDPSRKILRYDTYTSDNNLYNSHLFEYKESYQKEMITYPDGSRVAIRVIF